MYLGEDFFSLRTAVKNPRSRKEREVKEFVQSLCRSFDVECRIHYNVQGGITVSYKPNKLEKGIWEERLEFENRLEQIMTSLDYQSFWQGGYRGGGDFYYVYFD